MRPEVLLLDEPCSALDPRSTATIEELIVELRDELAIVIVTHNLQQAYRVADHVAFMYLGELVEYGPAEQVFGAPRAKRTRDYVSGGVRMRLVCLRRPAGPVLRGRLRVDAGEERAAAGERARASCRPVRAWW